MHIVMKALLLEFQIARTSQEQKQQDWWQKGKQLAGIEPDISPATTDSSGACIRST